MEKVTVIVSNQVPGEQNRAKTKIVDLRLLNEKQKKYFHDAHAAFLRNEKCWDFDGPWFFNSRSPFHKLVKGTGREVVKHPLYKALMELWLALGVNQGEMAHGSDYDVVHIVI